MTEQEIMVLACRAGFGGQQRNTLKMKLLCFSALLQKEWVDNHPWIIRDAPCRKCAVDAIGTVVQDGGIPI